MKKITLITILLLCHTAFSHSTPVCSAELVQDEIIIPDVVLEQSISEYIENRNYAVPTKLVFPNLVTVKTPLYFDQNTNLVEIEAPLLENVEDRLTFTKNSGLLKVSFPKLNNTGYLILEQNPDIMEVSLPSLMDIEVNLAIYHNPVLESVVLSNLQNIGGSFKLWQNPVLGLLDIVQLKSICGNFYLNNSPSITSLHLPNFQSMGYCGEFDNYPTSLHISHNANLEIVYAPNLEKVLDLYVRHNPQLIKLNLCSLEVLNEFSVAYNHPSINPGPPFCYTDDDGQTDDETEDGAENVDDEEDDTNREEEEEEEEEKEEDREKIYPNPSEDYIYVDTETQFTVISIFDLSGNLVKTFRSEEERYDVSGIAPGMYLMMVQYPDGATSQPKKIIVR
ncbi:MAG: T9SS type A sorting domain-containing protein [Flavobacteriaceae bacterium]|uniref:T9SS type A sorting domain-containing protein n=1 Tax=Flagellimonas sp. SN16 TaxID=3415142 RepID=UPI003C6B900D|nr:T9SS type A sorting domain-containing protein [Flavobacteriaceae bacterium]